MARSKNSHSRKKSKRHCQCLRQQSVVAESSASQVQPHKSIDKENIQQDDTVSKNYQGSPKQQDDAVPEDLKGDTKQQDGYFYMAKKSCEG